MNFSIDKATCEDITDHFMNCTESYIYEINKRISLESYVKKIRKNANTFELWEQNILIGLIAVYTNRGINHPAYITNFSLIVSCQNKGLSKILISKLISYLKELKVESVLLEVKKDNNIAKSLYSKYGFEKVNDASNISEFWMKKIL